MRQSDLLQQLQCDLLAGALSKLGADRHQRRRRREMDILLDFSGALLGDLLGGLLWITSLHHDASHGPNAFFPGGPLIRDELRLGVLPERHLVDGF